MTVLNCHHGASLVDQWWGLCLPVKEVRVQSLTLELRSHMPHSQRKTQNIKQMQLCKIQ